MMKYVVMSARWEQTDKVSEKIFLFDKSIIHADFVETMYMHKIGFPKRNILIALDGECVSAGFVQNSSNGLRCYGTSESLGIESRPEIDTALLQNCYR